MARQKRAFLEKKLRQRRERRAAFARDIPKAVKRAIGPSTTRETPLHVRGRGVELDESLREYIRGRVAFKLGKYGLRLTRITVRIERLSGPGTSAVSCRFKVVLPNTQTVVVEATHPTTVSAFDMAADATERGVRRLLQRTRKSRARRDGTAY